MHTYVHRYFPKIFGPNEDQPLDKQMTIREFEKLTIEVNILHMYIVVTGNYFRGRFLEYWFLGKYVLAVPIIFYQYFYHQYVTVYLFIKSGYICIQYICTYVRMYKLCFCTLSWLKWLVILLWSTLCT